MTFWRVNKLRLRTLLYIFQLLNSKVRIDRGVYVNANFSIFNCEIWLPQAQFLNFSGSRTLDSRTFHSHKYLVISGCGCCNIGVEIFFHKVQNFSVKLEGFILLWIQSWESMKIKYDHF